MSTNYNEIMDIIYSLETNTSKMPDQEIINKILSWTPSYSCESAAEGYFMVVSTVLHFRPHLEEQLIIKAIEPLYYLGIDNPQDVIGWINHYHLSKGPYRPWKYGSHWLGTAHTKVEIFQRALLQLSEED
ncbi:hypothetical protein J31TS6_22720 [Brevibacillus reuszeri]|uniref:hypothetical protein n=1 Tax=Brevibacillus reuszeri TaxID=54915 RepID=UPI001B15B8AC|nr:hypothetical protein [Brevibacillus reuszeri]GIO06244.1 hypothetical protein J31TS6_22720 [Brevibacillus reuszeri]